MVQHIVLGVMAPYPRGIAAQYPQHVVYDLLPCRTVGHVLHLLEQVVEFGVVVIGCVLAPLAHLGLRAIEQEQEIFRIGVVGVPAKIK